MFRPRLNPSDVEIETCETHDDNRRATLSFFSVLLIILLCTRLPTVCHLEKTGVLNRLALSRQLHHFKVPCEPVNLSHRLDPLSYFPWNLLNCLAPIRIQCSYFRIVDSIFLAKCLSKTSHKSILTSCALIPQYTNAFSNPHKICCIETHRTHPETAIEPEIPR